MRDGGCCAGGLKLRALFLRKPRLEFDEFCLHRRQIRPRHRHRGLPLSLLGLPKPIRPELDLHGLFTGSRIEVNVYCI